MGHKPVEVKSMSMAEAAGMRIFAAKSEHIDDRMLAGVCVYDSRSVCVLIRVLIRQLPLQKREKGSTRHRIWFGGQQRS